MNVVAAFNKVCDLSTELKNFSTSIRDVCEDVNKETSPGISLLQAKSATLMRYNRNLVRLAHARIKGHSITPIAEKLVEDWVAMEKIRPMERKLRHQIDTLLKTSSRSVEDVDAAGRHRPNPAAMVINSDDEGDEDGKAGVYRPPRIAEVAYDGAGDRKQEREKKERARAQARAVRKEGVRELLAELKGRPEEILDNELGGSQKSGALQRLLREDEQRTKFEEENFTRLNVTRKDKKRRRDIEKAAEGPNLDGTDELAGLIAVADRAMMSNRDGDQKNSSGERDRNEEEYKMRQLDEITDRMTGSADKSAKSNRKKRRR